MYCTGCGKEIKDNTKFCVFCGCEAMSKETTSKDLKREDVITKKSSVSESNTYDKKRIKKVIAIFSMLAAALFICGGVALYMFRPEVRMNNALKDGDLDKAYTIYKEKLNKKEISQETENLLTNYTEKIWTEYDSGEKSVKEIKDKIDRISLFKSDNISSYLEKSYDKIEVIEQIERNMFLAETNIALGAYKEAIKDYNEVLELDNDFEDAKVGMKTALDTYSEKIIDQMINHIDNGNYTYARKMIDDEISDIHFYDSADLESFLDEVNTAYVTNILKKVEECNAKKDYESAKYILNDALNVLPGNSELENALYEKMVDKYMEACIDADAEKMFEVIYTDDMFNAICNKSNMSKAAMIKKTNKEIESIWGYAKKIAEQQGVNFEITYKIVDIKDCSSSQVESLNRAFDNLEEEIDINIVDITEAKLVNIEILLHFKDKPEIIESKLYITKIDNEWYIYPKEDIL